MSDLPDFAWSWPCYVLARNYSFDPETNDINDYKEVAIAHVEAQPTESGAPPTITAHAIATFTDAATAQEFRDKCGEPFELVELASPQSLFTLLVWFHQSYDWIVIDPRMVGKQLLYYQIRRMLPQVYRWMLLRNQ